MINDTLDEADEKMGKSVEATREDFATIRAGRATPAVFNKITVEYYGSPTPLQQLATFTQPEARVINISPFDISAMNAIEKAIRESDLGINLGGGSFDVRPEASTDVLTLHVAPVQLDLLGALVNTSPIDVSITAHSGQGLILGNIVTDLANLFNDLPGQELNIDTLNQKLSDLLALVNDAVGSIPGAEVPTVQPAEGPRYKIGLFVNNLFDKHYYNGLADLSALSTANSQAHIGRDFRRYGGIRASYTF